MIHSDFVHLHLHTEYSLLDGAIRLRDAITKASRLKMPALAITDHGNIFGAIEFYQEACSLGVKPIIGCEFYIAPSDRREKKTHGIQDASYHLTILVKDMEGYKNLLKLVTTGYLEGFYYRPRIDKEVLASHNKGLILLSGCIKGEIPVLILNNQYDEAKRVASEFREIFGKENFYLELQDQGLEEQIPVNEALIRMSKELGVPLVATNDVHYIDKADAKAHDVLLCIQTGKTLSNKDRLAFSSNEFYFRNPEEMKSLFREVPEAISNTLEIAKRCNLKIDEGMISLPHYEVPDDGNLNDYLRKICLQGLDKRFSGKVPDEVKDRLFHELEIIQKMNYSSYFLIIWDLISYAKKKGIPVGPGRGSAAGSLVAYALGICDIDPIKYGLLFERFLNPERVSLPDIDIDFADDRRDEVIDYVTKRYGNDRVAQVITFGKMNARAVIRDVGRVLEIPYKEVDRIAKLIPPEPNITIEDAMRRVPEFKEITKQRKELIEIAISLEGLARHVSTHAAGVVISRDPLINYLPLYKDPKTGVVMTGYAKDSIERIGLLKMDFLGLKTLTIIREVVSMVQKNRAIKIDIHNIPMDDEATFKLLCEGDSIGLFQLESKGMRDLLRRLKPTEFKDLVALLALHRPGPLNSGMVDEFILSKHNKRAIKYLHPRLKPILEETYGVIVYQEQVMGIASTLAGFTMGEADRLRRAMSRKDGVEMERMKRLFVDGATHRGIPKEKAEAIYNLMGKFAEYGFNKSHSAAYALISYWTAYLKAHFPLEYMAALLTSELNNTDKISFYVRECKKMGIVVLPPDINHSDTFFKVEDGAVRFGLAAVKNVGLAASRAILKARERIGSFESIFKFCEEIDPKIVNKRVIESLIKCGAFDGTGARRAQLYHGLDYALEMAERVQKERESGQSSLFDILDDDSGFRRYHRGLPDVDEWPHQKLLAFEKELLGLYLSAHPLSQYEKEIKRFTDLTIEETEDLKEGTSIRICGIIQGVKRINTKDGKEMAVAILEDQTGSIEIVFFPDLYQKERKNIREDAAIFLQGEFTLDDGRPKIMAKEVIPVEEMRKRLAKELHISLKTLGLDEDRLLELRKILDRRSGKIPVYLHLHTTQHGEVVLSTRCSVSLDDGLISEVENLIGEGAVSLR